MEPGATISLSEIKANAAKRRAEMDEQLASLGYKNIGGRYVRIPTPADTAMDALDIESKTLDIETKRRALAGGEEPELSATLKERLAGTKEAQSVLGQLEKLFNQGGFDTGRSQTVKGALRRFFGPTFPGLKQGDTEQQFDIAAKNMLSSILKSLSGAQVSDRERAFLEDQIPRLSDTKQEIANKLGFWKGRLSTQVAEIQNAGGARGTQPKDDIDAFLDSF